MEWKKSCCCETCRRVFNYGICNTTFEINITYKPGFCFEFAVWRCQMISTFITTKIMSTFFLRIPDLSFFFFFFFVFNTQVWICTAFHNTPTSFHARIWTSVLVVIGSLSPVLVLKWFPYSCVIISCSVHFFLFFLFSLKFGGDAFSTETKSQIRGCTGRKRPQQEWVSETNCPTDR